MNSETKITSVEERSGTYIVRGIHGEITRRSAVRGDVLIGFSNNIIVVQRNQDLFTFTANFNQIARHSLAKEDVVRAVVGDNILVYRPIGNFLTTYDSNFREIEKHTSY